MDLNTLLPVKNVILPPNSNGFWREIGKMAKNGTYMSHTRPSEYFEGSYLRIGKGTHSSSLRGVDFGPTNAFTGNKRDFTAKKYRFWAENRQNGQK